ncbi:MEKHLA domain-containing protein [Calothrix sp. PCC 6303]|uniref:MEKHLA domain-containing protein n=1 Tax=Calothrix sp. PCC 6303 TaxID=1170562 RepID=UPI0002A04B4A|nr:MEKHLA domain-containing protein [Calothrix sp. PCC 6303]AFZ02779.1 MEKHLA domain protein [Calothrix sp. PCC 6303]
MTNTIPHPWQQEAIILHTQRLLCSYQHWTGKLLFNLDMPAEELAENLFIAPFVVLSHGMEADPIYNYGNAQALNLWEISWEDFTKMPSRKSVREIEEGNKETLLRQALLEEAVAKGFVENYGGIRTSTTGKRFQIDNVTLWTVLNEDKQRCGHAAMFSKWYYI